MPRTKCITYPRALPKQQVNIPPQPKDCEARYVIMAASFHISAMREWLAENPQPIVTVSTGKWCYCDDWTEDSVEAADLMQPLLLLEIAPDLRDFFPDTPEDDWERRGYHCAGGDSAIEKARRLGIQTLPAIVMRTEQHVDFIYEHYERYAEYWNGKLGDRHHDAGLWQDKNIAEP